jgi:hypothetical protein
MGITESYFDDIPKVFLNFQMLEDALRNYLFRCEVFILVKMRGIIDLKFDLNPIEKASLGKLVDLFEKHNKNIALIERLRKIIPDRNFFAHDAYTHIYDEKGKSNETKVVASNERLQNAIKESHECVLDVFTEIAAIEARFSGKGKIVNRSDIDAMYLKMKNEMDSETNSSE